MAHALYILRDDDFDVPIYASLPSDELDEEVWDSVVTAVHEAVENDGPRTGVVLTQEQWVAWKLIARSGVSFVAVVDEEHDKSDVEEYLGELSTHYLGEVDDVRFPDTDGLEDVLIDIIAPWDE